jgi:NAD-dependent oxidoreductase involved in siderophore biosynthesis
MEQRDVAKKRTYHEHQGRSCVLKTMYMHMDDEYDYIDIADTLRNM